MEHKLFLSIIPAEFPLKIEDKKVDNPVRLG